MSKFITGKELSIAVDEVIWKANENLMIVSPFIKLDKHFRELFDKQRHNHKLHILLMFGKNEGRVDKSFNRDDLEYFKQFPNISIVYVPKLHAKYYANEKVGIVTSINLYDYSFENNIEFGVLYENKSNGFFSSKSTDTEVWDNCIDIANDNAVIYINRPMYLNTDYRGSKVLCDLTAELYNGKSVRTSRKLDDFDEKLDFKEVFNKMPSRTPANESAKVVYNDSKSSYQKSFEPGYCIRTGEKIPFNTKSPFSKQAYQSWSKYKNENFAEKFCHFSGEPSSGDTSFKKPILAKNWKKAQQA
jgi:hypothetical protein